MIGGIGFSPMNFIQSPYGSYGGVSEIQKKALEGTPREIPDNAAERQDKIAKTTGTQECETCKNRKYQDGSNENVSFKSASHVSPTAAGSAVRAHEGEHVANAYDKAEESGGKVLQASVKIQTAVCPECGRTYVSGGTTTTRIRYGNEDNPYQKAKKAIQGDALRGMNVDIAG